LKLNPQRHKDLDTTKVDVIDEETGEPVLDHDGNVKQVDGDGVFRCWPVQQFWWRTRGNKILSQGSRFVGKSLRIKLSTFAFPFVAPGAEMVLTAPEGAHLDALTNNVETLFIKNKIAESMLAKDQRGRIKHRPFQVNFQNGGYILARLPKFDGSGIRGTHPLYLEQDEGCLASDTLILTKRGYVPIKDVKPISFSADGYTPLYDSIGLAINLFAESKNKTLINIFTDGGENRQEKIYQFHLYC